MPGSMNLVLLKAPYRKVDRWRSTDEIVYLTADEEGQIYYCPGQRAIDEKGHFNKRISVRNTEDEILVVTSRYG